MGPDIERYNGRRGPMISLFVLSSAGFRLRLGRVQFGSDMCKSHLMSVWLVDGARVGDVGGGDDDGWVDVLRVEAEQGNTIDG